jgi:hypothetical protein
MLMQLNDNATYYKYIAELADKMPRYRALTKILKYKNLLKTTQICSENVRCGDRAR